MTEIKITKTYTKTYILDKKAVEKLEKISIYHQKKFRLARANRSQSVKILIEDFEIPKE